MVLISKEKPLPGNSLDGKLTGDILDMDDVSKLEVIKCYYQVAVTQTPEYQKLRKELENYAIVLSHNSDVVDLPEMNKQYAEAQAYHSRVTAIEMQAISNFDAWSNLRKALDSYVSEKSSEYVVEESILELPNTAIQQAAVRNRLKKEYGFLSQVAYKENEAKSFMKVVESKKSDLSTSIANLTRQVKVIALDRETIKR